MAQERLKARHWGLLVLLFTSFMFPYIDRVNLSVAGPTMMKDLHLSPTLLGVALSAFTLTYMFSCLVAGPFVDWVGTRLANIVGGILWAGTTLANGVIGSFTSLLAVRMGLGVGEGPLTPVADRVVAHEFPKEHRATAVSIYFAGNKFGLTLGVPLSASAIALWGWHAAFYVTGVISALWLVAWIAFYREPQQVRQERIEIRRTRHVPYWALAGHRSTWGLLFGQMGYFYAYTVFMTWMPTYLILARHMTVLKTGIVGSLPFLVGVLTTMLGGWLGDRLTAAGWSRTAARKTFIIGGLLLTAGFIWLVAYAPSTNLAVVFLVAAVAAIGLATGQLNTLPVDIAPGHLVATLGGIQAFGGNIGGLIAPTLTGILYQQTGSFVGPLLIAAGMCLVGALSIGLLVGQAEPAFRAAAQTAD